MGNWCPFLPVTEASLWTGPICRPWPGYSFSWNSQAEQEMYTPPGMPRSRSLTRLTMRVGLEHFGQSVLLVVSIIFLRSPVLAILAMGYSLNPMLARSLWARGVPESSRKVT